MAKSVKLKPTKIAPKAVPASSPSEPAPADLDVQLSPTPASSRNAFVDIIYSIIEPGVNTGLLLALHVTFLFSIGSLLGLLYLTEMREVAPWVLLLSNVVLYPTIIWFISKLQFPANPSAKLSNKQD